MIVFGTDQASCDGLMRWELQEQRGVRFAFYRKNLYLYQDRYFVENTTALRLNAPSIKPCLYSVWCPQYDRQAQFVAFKQNIIAKDWHRIALDVERYHSYGVNSGKVLGDLLWMLKAVADWHGKKPLIYTRKYLWDGYYSNKPDWGLDWDLWVASTQRSSPLLPIGWTDWTIWQYSFEPNLLGPFYGSRAASQDLDIADASFLE